MTSDLKKIENLEEVVDALDQGRGEQLVHQLEMKDYYRERAPHRKELYQSRKQQERADKISEVILQEIIPYFSWQKGKEIDISFSALKERTSFSEPMLGRIGESEVEFGGEKIKLKEFMYDSFVRDASPLRGIAIILGMNGHQRAQQYLENTGQHAKWCKQYQLQREEKERTEEEQREYKRLVQEFASLLLTKGVQETKDNWPRQMAILVDSRKEKKVTNLPLSKLEELFWHYQKAVEDNIPVSLDYLSEMIGLEKTVINRQLQYAGLPPMNPALRKGWRKKTVRLSPAEKQRIKNSKNTFPRGDLFFFLGLPSWLKPLQLLSLPDGRETRYGINHFSYRLASEIYQAKDYFSPSEIQYVVEIDNKTYRQYVINKKEISKEIILKLRQIYPELATKIKHPYLTPEIRQLQQEQTLEAVVLRAIETAIETGARGMDELKQMTRFSDQTLRAYSQKKDIALPLKYKK